MSLFYQFNQMNSDGYFVGYKFIIIEANDVSQANKIFRGLDLYRNYCSCCGRRWDYLDESHIGDIEPMIFHETLPTYLSTGDYDPKSWKCISASIIYFNGEIKNYGNNYKLPDYVS